MAASATPGHALTSPDVQQASQYRPNELGRRLSYIFVCAALSGAFGGLLAFGLTQITTGPLLRWQYLYLVEGLISFMAAPVVWFVLPNSLDQVRRLPLLSPPSAMRR